MACVTRWGPHTHTPISQKSSEPSSQTRMTASYACLVPLNLYSLLFAGAHHLFSLCEPSEKTPGVGGGVSSSFTKPCGPMHFLSESQRTKRCEPLSQERLEWGLDSPQGLNPYSAICCGTSGGISQISLGFSFLIYKTGKLIVSPSICLYFVNV